MFESIRRTGENFIYDALIYCSSADLQKMRKLAGRLAEDGIRVWFEEHHLGAKPRSSEERKYHTQKIQSALDVSRALILAMSTGTFGSVWPEIERQSRPFRDVEPGRKFVPLRLDSAPVPDLISHFAYVDWRKPDDRDYDRLLRLCLPPERVDLGVRQPNYIFTPHSDPCIAVALSNDESRAYSASLREICSWQMRDGNRTGRFSIHTADPTQVSLLGNERYAVSGEGASVLEFWDLRTGRKLNRLAHASGAFNQFFVSRDNLRAVGLAEGSITVWDLSTHRLLTHFETPADGLKAAFLSVDGKQLGLATARILHVIDCDTGTFRFSMEAGLSDTTALALTDTGTYAITGSQDGSVRLWDLALRRSIGTLEGHVHAVRFLSVTADSRIVASGSDDASVKLWDLPAGTCISTLKGPTTGAVRSIALGSSGSRGAHITSDGRISLWTVNDLTSKEGRDQIARYTNAKVLLVGDTGVGKSALALRLTTDTFAATISTDGAWATQMRLPDESPESDVEREIWLWDFAGQSDYRLIHQLFFDETSLAILVFNPQSDDPFEGLAQWDLAVTRAARRPFAKLLVAGRCDRGGLVISKHAVTGFQTERGYAAYFETSARTGVGCTELRKAVVAHIDWDAIPWTSSPRIFKLLKDAIIAIKDQTATSRRPLLRVGELRQQVQLTLPNVSFTFEEFEAVLALLAGPGIVWRLDFGDFVLLQPERINAYAAALIRTVRSHVDEIGVVSEDDVFAGHLDYQDMSRLPTGEEMIVLRAMHQTFIDRGICLREHTDKGTILVFPSHFRRERLELGAHPSPLVTYRFSGALDEIYATLVVRMHYTSAFEKDQLWRFAADFRTQEGRRLGFSMRKRAEGRGEITVYFDPDIPDDTKVTFIRYIHDHLIAKDPELQRERHYVCQKCGTPVENRSAVAKRIARGEKDISCSDCESRVRLVDLIEEKFASEEVRLRARTLYQQASAVIDNESRELILLGQAFAVAGESGQIFRSIANSDWGIDGEIEFKDYEGRASGKRLYLQLKSGDSYLYTRRTDGAEVFTVKNHRHAKYWRSQAYPVMLVIRTSDALVRWMDVSSYLKSFSENELPRQILFKGEPFSAATLLKLRDAVIPFPREFADLPSQGRSPGTSQ